MSNTETERAPQRPVLSFNRRRSDRRDVWGREHMNASDSSGQTLSRLTSERWEDFRRGAAVSGWMIVCLL